VSIRNFIFSLIGISALLLGASYFLVREWYDPAALPFIWGAILLSTLSGIISYIIVFGGLDKRIPLFTTYILGSMLAKLMLGLATITIVALKFKPYSTAFVLTYFFCYFIFTGFEVVALMRNLRPFSKIGQRSTHEENASS
jgi:hypothetical protein